ncbi:MAG: hypothetical protein ACYSW7_06660 [Planctomycetota bacterium]
MRELYYVYSTGFACENGAVFGGICSRLSAVWLAGGAGLKDFDRLTHRVHIIEANGASYRLEQSRKRLARKKKLAK